MSDSVRPHRQQPTRLRCPWDSPGKNTGVGCHLDLEIFGFPGRLENLGDSCREAKFFFFPSLNCFRNNSLELRWALTEACGLFIAGFELSLVAEGGLLSSCGRWASLVVEQGL